MSHTLLRPGFLLVTLLALAGAAASMLAVDRALAQMSELFRICLGITVSLFPIYAAVRAYRGLEELELSPWIRGAVAVAILAAGHGGIVVVAARVASQ